MLISGSITELESELKIEDPIRGGSYPVMIAYRNRHYLRPEMKRTQDRKLLFISDSCEKAAVLLMRTRPAL